MPKPKPMSCTAGTDCADCGPRLPLPPSPPPLPNNVRVEFFRTGIDCGTLPSLDGVSPAHTVYVPRFGLGGGGENKPNLEGFQTGNNFAAVLRGLVPVRLEGNYTFILTVGQTDTASLTIDGTELIATGCSRGRRREYSVTVHLGSGAHLLHLVFADDGWSDHLVRPPPPPPGASAASGCVLETWYDVAGNAVEDLLANVR